MSDFTHAELLAACQWVRETNITCDCLVCDTLKGHVDDIEARLALHNSWYDPYYGVPSVKYVCDGCHEKWPCPTVRIDITRLQSWGALPAEGSSDPECVATMPAEPPVGSVVWLPSERRYWLHQRHAWVRDDGAAVSWPVLAATAEPVVRPEEDDR